MLRLKFCEKEQSTMMKRLLSLILAVSLTAGIVLTAPMVSADTYSQSEMDLAMTGSVSVDVT